GEHLVDAVDVYVEDIAFSVEDLRRVADAAKEYGLAVRCHADQLGHSGAAEAAVAVGARSADHLNHIGPAGIAALSPADGTIGVLAVGKRADFGVLDAADPALIAYRPGHNPVAETWIAGARVF